MGSLLSDAKQALRGSKHLEVGHPLECMKYRTRTHCYLGTSDLDQAPFVYYPFVKRLKVSLV